MPITITSLPVELLTLICDFLEPREWGEFRATCQQIYGKTLEAYNLRYFRKISVILTHEGLKHLEGIAGSETIRGSVQELWIIANLFEGGSELNNGRLQEVNILDLLLTTGHPPTWGDWLYFKQVLQAAYGLYQVQVGEHQVNLKGSRLYETLVKCLPRMENLMSVGVQSLHTDLLLSTPVDNTCLGLRRFKGMFSGIENYRKWPMIHPRHQEFSVCHAWAFSHLLKAIVKSGGKVQSLSTCADQSCGMKMQAFVLSKSDYEQLLPLLSDLVTLHLSIRLRDQRLEEFREATFKCLLKILARVSPTLKTLSFAQWSPIEEVSSVYFQNLSQRVHFSQLKELNLYSIEVRTEDLKVFLRTAAPTLKRLTLSLVSLIDPLITAPNLGVMSRDTRTWYSSLPVEVKDEITGLWKRVFSSWADQLDLHFVRLSDLGYRGRDIRLIDHLRSQLRRPNTWPDSPTRPLYFDTQKTSITFKQWVTQIRVEMWHRPGQGNPRLPATSRLSFRGLR
ncbi:hypothetical protein N7454_001006 [Penicillium verhagenii]|nr:hypothetical protein N7454_001006 [Penicillium verhagenii]